MIYNFKRDKEREAIDSRYLRVKMMVAWESRRSVTAAGAALAVTCSTRTLQYNSGSSNGLSEYHSMYHINLRRYSLL